MNAHPQLAITWLAVSSLKLDPRNPREHSAHQIQQLAKSIKTFGFNAPILVDDNNLVVAGYGRARAGELLGLTEVPVIRLSHLSSAQRDAFRIADNRLCELSDWNAQLLGETFRELQAQNLHFDLDATGFSTAQIDLLIEGLSIQSDEGAPDSADRLPPETNFPAMSTQGDLWILRDHRILCGNALDPAVYEQLLGGQMANMVFSDPPYNVPINGHASGLGSIHHREFAMASGEMTQLQFEAFLSKACRLHAQCMANGALAYFCMDWRHAAEMLAAGKASYTELKNICIWVKPNPGMGSFYRSQHELILVFKNGRGSHRNNVELGRHGRNRSNVWNYPSPQSFARTGEEGCLATIHPTVKPVRLVADAILDCTARGDTVLDGFLGSGTTVIAAERTGRRCYGIEIDPLYVDAIVRRWQAYSGDFARHALTNRSFDEIAAEARHDRQ